MSARRVLPGEGAAGTRSKAQAASERAVTATGTETIRVLLVDDHPVVADGVRAMLAAEVGIEVVGAARSAAAAHELIGRERPDVVVCDAEVGPDSGFEILRRHRDGAAFVIFSAFDRRSY